MALTPKSIEEQWVQHVNGHAIAKEVFLLSGPTPETFRVALCEDGKLETSTSQLSVRKHLQALFGLWGANAPVQVEVFSFIGNTSASYELLLGCHMFYLIRWHL